MRFASTNLLVLQLVFAIGATFSLQAQESGPAKPLNLEGVKWVGAPPTAQGLQGKSIAVLVYASWCPKCNQWSGELFEQVKASLTDKPTVLLAIYADQDPGKLQAYVTERNFFAPNIIHGFDPEMPAKLGLPSELFNYIIYSPTGEATAKGSAAVYFGDAKVKQFALSKDIKASDGKFKLLTPGLSPGVQGALWPLELGQGNEATLTRARGTLNEDDQAELDGFIEKMMQQGLEEVQAGYKGELPQRFAAYEQAQKLAGMFKTFPQSKTAKEVVLFLEKDEAFKNELAAKKAYEASMQKAPAARRNLLKAISSRFEGTHYGKLAAEETAK